VSHKNRALLKLRYLQN